MYYRTIMYEERQILTNKGFDQCYWCEADCLKDPICNVAGSVIYRFFGDVIGNGNSLYLGLTKL